MGVVMRRTPGITRWAKWAWCVSDILPGAGPASWKELARTGDVTVYHAATLPLTLYPTDTEAYRVELQSAQPSVYVALRAGEGDWPLVPVAVTASPYEGQDYGDSSEDVVERIAMPQGMIAWIAGFIERHHEEEVFVKRQRNKTRVDRVQDGIGDARIAQATDVYRAPRTKVAP
jgi:hypothetical protein